MRSSHYKKLSAIVDALESGSRPKGGVSIDSGDIPSLGAEHLNDEGGFNFSKIKKIENIFYEKMRNGKIKYGDILIVKDGATTGKVSFVDHDFPFKKAAANEHVFILRVDNKISSSKYVFHFLKSPKGKDEILSDFRGATVGGISRGFLDKVNVPLPPLAEQQRIAEILDKAKEIKFKRELAIEKLDSLAQSIFVDMFLNNPIYGSQSISDICTLVTDGTHYTPKDIEIGIPFLTVRNMSEEGLDFKGCSFISRADFDAAKSGNCAPQINDVLFSKDGTVGKVHVVEEPNEFAVLSSIAILRPNENKVLSQYLGYALRSSQILDSAISKKTGAAIRRIILSNLKSIQIPIPPIEKQRIFLQKISELHRIKAKSKLDLQRLNDLFISTQSQAFSSQL